MWNNAPSDVALSAERIARFLGASHTGPNAVVTGVASLADATPDDLAFCTYDDPARVEESDAGIVICRPGIPELPERALVQCADPKLGFVKVADAFLRPERDGTVVHPTAVVEDGATVGEDCLVGPFVHVAGCVTLGDRCTVHAGTVLGSPGFGFARDEEDRPIRQLHVGTVRVGDDVEIGPNCSVDRAVFDATVVGKGTVLSAGVHLAHQVEVGRYVSMAYGCGVSGSTTVGDRVVFHPHVSVADHLTVGDDSEVGIGSAVLDDVEPGTTVVGSPARPIDRSD